MGFWLYEDKTFAEAERFVDSAIEVKNSLSYFIRRFHKNIIVSFDTISKMKALSGLLFGHHKSLANGRVAGRERGVQSDRWQAAQRTNPGGRVFYVPVPLLCVEQ